MFRYALELAYNGTNYHGWQVQPNAITIQEIVNQSITKLLRTDTYVVGAGRTDAGVHASYLVAHFEVEKSIDDTELFLFKINNILPYDIVVYSLQLTDGMFHSRFSAISRTYHYNLTLKKNPFRRYEAYKPVYSLNFEEMNLAAQLLFDYIDFTSFSRAHSDTKTNNCKIMYAKWIQISEHEWQFVIRADRFLRNMVRAIVGTLLDVGRGKITLDDFRNVIEAKDRNRAGASAPAHGLFLMDVEYPEDELFKPLVGQLKFR